MIRRATDEDLEALTAMEERASSAALAHVFPPDLPFPLDDVRARWSLVLDDPSQHVLVSERSGQPVGYAAFGGGWLQHFGVVPELWGSGCAVELHEAVVRGLSGSETSRARLWVLVENHRARSFYRREGWVDSDITEPTGYPPHPPKMQMTLALRGL